MHVLLTEDNALIASGIVAGLEAQGFSVAHAATAGQADSLLRTASFDLMILDLGLPDEDGLRFLQRLRRRGLELPVLILTARDAVTERVSGLQAGADDYLVKPFDLRELAARPPACPAAPRCRSGDTDDRTRPAELRSRRLCGVHGRRTRGPVAP